MSGTVVIVDDSLTVRMDLAEAFAAAGFLTRLCATVADARRALASEDVDVVVLDVMLPDGDGVELLREIRGAASRQDLPVLMLSTEAEVADRVRAIKTGADDYVGKPYDRGYVVSKARELVRARSGAAVSEEVTVLIIDDSVTFRETLKDQVVRAGYLAATAATGEEGLRIAADLRPSAIIVDGQLPGIDGATVIRRIRLDTALRGTPCLLLTASDDRSAELRALDAGADAFLHKDDELDVVVARLAAVLRRTGPAAASETVSALGPCKVLVIDDDSTYLDGLATTMRDDGYDVVLARSGEQALELLAVGPVDCVLLDLEMPGLGGQETCRRIKAAPIVRDVPVVILTVHDERRSVLESLAAGADDLIPKSTELAVLKARVRAQIRRKRFEDETRRVREQLLRSELAAVEARAARQLAEARGALADELERKNQELEAFSYSVSHDLRAPLRSINGFAAALAEDYSGALDDRGRDYLRRITSATRRMNDLIEDLLKLAHVTNAELSKQQIDLSAIAQRVVTELAERSPDRRVDVTISPNIAAYADPGLVQTVLENLVGNAWKFTAKRPDARIELGAAERDGSSVVFIRDNGVGFDPARASAMFRPFHRLHAASQFEGTGIGLATVHRIITRHGGRVWAEANRDQGATIYFRFEGDA